jgi:hypothetical protein
MSEDNKYGLEDLVSSAVLQKPLEFETAFNDIVLDRIRDAVENKKIEVAKQLYGYEPEVADQEPSEEEENGENA